MYLGATTRCITTLSIATLAITILSMMGSIATLSMKGTQQNAVLSVTATLIIILLCVVVLSGVTLIVVAPLNLIRAD